jgi:hypothetical protein
VVQAHARRALRAYRQAELPGLRIGFAACDLRELVEAPHGTGAAEERSSGPEKTNAPVISMRGRGAVTS